MAVKKYDWDQLKADFMLSQDSTLKSFCIRRGLGDPSINSHVARMTSGWAGEKDEVKAEATQRFIAMASDEMMMDTKEVRLEHAKIARDVVLKAAKYLSDEGNSITNVEQARKLLETGVKIQREAIGLSSNPGKDSKLTQINIDLSRFGIEDADEEELLGIIRAIKSTRRKLTDSLGEQSEE